MEWVDLATDLIAPFEGCHKKKRDGLIYPYLDTLAKPPVWTQGYGITYGVGAETAPITSEEALSRFKLGVRKYGLRCLKLAPGLVNKPRCLAAVTSWAWNCGVGAFQQSRLRRAINEERWEDAARFILKPDTAGGVVYRGLQRRRLAEASLFLTGSNA